MQAIEAPRRTLTDPREGEDWFQRLPAHRQDELRTSWAKEDSRRFEWAVLRTRQCKRSALDGGLVMLLPILVANLFVKGFLGVVGMLLLGYACGCAIGALVFVGRCGRFLAALLGMLGFLVVQLPQGIGHDVLAVIMLMLAWTLATYAYGVFGIMHEIGGRD